MSGAPDIAACAALVQRADPERFRAVMACPVPLRAPQFAVYAFNVEVSRAPWVTKEPMIAEMRLQWWADALEEIAGGGPVRGHEVTTALAAVLTPEAARDLGAVVEARRRDIYPEGFADEAALDSYLMDTGARLLRVAVQAVGTAETGPLDDLGFGAAVANYLRAIPALEARGRAPLVDGTPQGVAALARRGLARWQAGSAAKRAIPRPARLALLPAWQSEPLLRMAVREPGRVADGTLALGPARAAARLVALRLRGGL